MDMRKAGNRSGLRKSGWAVGRLAAGILEKPAVKWIAAGLFEMVTAALLSRGILLAQFAPLGVAFVGACAGVARPDRAVRTSKLLPFAALVGGIFGYCMPNGQVDGLKYAAAAVLCFSAGIIFRDAKFFANRFFMPAAAAFSLLCTNSIYVFAQRVTAASVALFAAEVLLCAAATYFYASIAELMPVLEKKTGDGGEEEAEDLPDSGGTLGSWALYRENDRRLTTDRRVGLLVAAGSLIVSLEGFAPVAGMSVGRIIALLLVLIGASGGAFIGGSVGLCAGLALDLSAGMTPVFAACYGLTGLVTGIFRRFGVFISVLVFLAAGAAAMPWLWASLSVTVLYESLAAGALFLLFGRRAPALLALVFPRALTGDALGVVRSGETPFLPSDSAAGTRAYLRLRLDQMAAAFRGLHAAVLPPEPKASPDDPKLVFEAAVERTCRNCQMADVCWNREYTSTRNALNDATQPVTERGRAEAGDFPPYFTARCVSFRDFLANLNEAIAAQNYRKRYKKRIHDDVRLLCAQYDGMTRVLGDMVGEVAAAPSEDPDAAQRIGVALESINIRNVKIRATVNRAGRLSVDIETAEPALFTDAREEVLAVLSYAVGRPLAGFGCSSDGAACTGEEGGRVGLTRVSLWERENYRATIGVGLCQKKGEEQSGDNGTYFKTGDGRLYLLISDGMGSGSRAAAESGSLVRLLESFLRAGMSAATALKLICPAFAIKCESESFATIDLLCVDLYTGEAEFYKCGAAPSFVREGARIGGPVRRVTSNALPAGLFSPGALEADRTPLTLRDGDTVVMISDGIADTTRDNWVVRLLTEYRESGSGDLAAKLLEVGGRREGGRDDMTVLVLKLEAYQDEKQPKAGVKTA